MSRLKLKANKNLGKTLTAQDIFETLNNIQRLHIEGKLNVYETIKRDGIEYPSIADQWKADAFRRSRV